jgi:hypothetical protein
MQMISLNSFLPNLQQVHHVRKIGGLPAAAVLGKLRGIRFFEKRNIAHNPVSAIKSVYLRKKRKKGF